MRLSIGRHTVVEGLHNMVRHPLVTLASITTITLMLSLLSAFLVFTANARGIAEQVGQQPPIEISLSVDATAEERQNVADQLAADPEVLRWAMFTPQQNFDRFQSELDDSSLLEGFPVEEQIPFTFTVQLDDPAAGEAFRSRMLGMPGVREVALEQQVMQFLSRAIVWVNYATALTFLILGAIAFFIISNMVRVSVFARGDEIGIMKYVGATNWYIRVPYIIEGALIGLVGSILASGLVILVYHRLYESMMSGMSPDDLLALLPPGSLVMRILLVNLIAGVLVGGFGSAIAVRRHIRV